MKATKKKRKWCIKSTISLFLRLRGGPAFILISLISDCFYSTGSAYLANAVL